MNSQRGVDIREAVVDGLMGYAAGRLSCGTEVKN